VVTIVYADKKKGQNLLLDIEGDLSLLVDVENGVIY
jgi:hypothetical protein